MNSCSATTLNGNRHPNNHPHLHLLTHTYLHPESSVRCALSPPGCPKFPHLKSLTVSAMTCTVKSWRALLESHGADEA